MTYWKSREFKTLQDHWYKRLESEGFQDNEVRVGDFVVLKQRAARPYRDLGELSRETKECYYRILAQQVQEAEFRNDVDKLVLTWFADGMKIKKICEELERRGIGRCRVAVRFIIRRYEMRWGMRIYSRKELNLKD